MSKLYDASVIKTIEENTKTILNDNNEIKEKLSKNDVRSIGKLFEEIIKNNLLEIFPTDLVKETRFKNSRKSMADFTVVDCDNFIHIIDVKSHRLDTKFNMPNLTSVEKLKELYKTNNNYFSILLVKYTIDKNIFVVSDVIFTPVENIEFDCLTIGALGKGQIQLRNSNRVCLNFQVTRQQFLKSLYTKLMGYYDKQINKSQKSKIECKNFLKTF